MIREVVSYIVDLAVRYEVRAGLFFSLYVFATIICLGLLSVMVKKIRRKESVSAALSGFAAAWVSPYVYVLLFGRGVPYWVYAVISLVAAFGIRRAVVALRQHTKH